MARCEMKVDIQAPVETVWQITQNPKRRSEWDYRVNSMELLNGQKPEKGVTFCIEGTLLGRFLLEMEIVMFEPHRRSAAKLIKAKGMPVVSGGGSWKYTDLGTGRSSFQTTLLMNMGTFPLSKLLDKLMLQPFLYWMTKKSLKKLKTVAEADAGFQHS